MLRTLAQREHDRSKGKLVRSLAQALLAERPNLDSPADLWLLTQRALSPGWEPFQPGEAAALLDEAQALIDDPLREGQPPDWQWNLGADLVMLHRLADGATVSVIEALATIRLNLIAHRWHVDRRGVDRLVDIRWRFVECLGRLMMNTAPQPWERQLLDRPLGEALHATPGGRTRHRRVAAHLTQAELATRLGIARSTVVRWEADARRPTSRHAAALARELGGEQADYVSP